MGTGTPTPNTATASSSTSLISGKSQVEPYRNTISQIYTSPTVRLKPEWQIKKKNEDEDEFEEDDNGKMVKKINEIGSEDLSKKWLSLQLGFVSGSIILIWLSALPILLLIEIRKGWRDSIERLANSFSLPTMRDPKTGTIMEVRLSGMPLGARPQPIFAPRPLHDPLADTAIVLWDPTVDDRPAPKPVAEGEVERTPAEIEAEQTRLKLELERLNGPHKSLPDLLGIKKAGDPKDIKKVPVVLDPRLCKTLRPHQVEGVKFLYRCATGMVEQGAKGCIMADEMGLEKAIVACPSSLVKNWANEFDKWLGPGAINPLAVDGKQTKANLLTSVRQGTLVEELGRAPIGLLLCDEGHRLKMLVDNQTYAALNGINCERRFRKTYELPILRGRDSDSSASEVAAAEAKLKELTTKVQKLSSEELMIYYPNIIYKNCEGVGCQPLKMLGILRKLCNHPDLLDLHQDIPGSEKCFPDGYRSKDPKAPARPELSGKMTVLERERRWGNLRLDGTMQITKRQKLVDRFNDPEGKEFIFLLSSKAGGCGINLIGANRLILFDPDWNPASDQQALARVWRDGQKKNCFVYRFILTGSVEEKVFQRQSQKMKLSASVVDEQEDESRMFSRESLKELFRLNEQTKSDTHDVYKCKRCRDGKQIVKAPAMLYGDQSTWNHYTNPHMVELHDDLLRSEVGLNEVTACFQYIST
ncbi:hypothetical protein H4Q26_011376 [Puccinia striiformis f. sp. tritici PST-130]|nr:hypothetical protein H4Q26_011376 [Puccinia striiformis f. sp. tritici PST-130]